MAVAGAESATVFSAWAEEYTYKLLPAAIKAFSPSGEKAAAVAPEISNGITGGLFELDRPDNTYTWLGFDFVSETITLSPSSETASTLPGTLFNCVTVFEPAAAAASKIIMPAELPRKALPPGRSEE